MIFVVGGILVLYSIFIVWVLVSWFLLTVKKKGNIGSSDVAGIVSVLVPVRNEETNIETTLQSVLNNDLRGIGHEIVVIDDHSTDQTASLVEAMARDYEQIRLLSLSEEATGKKAAIELGVKEARGEVVLCTDGDCRVPNYWVKNYLEAYKGREENVFLFGAVRYKDKGNFFHGFLNIELSVLVVIGGATMGNGIPTMLNGANLSYRKEAFLKVEGYYGNREIPSGDDEFLARKIHSQFPDGVGFLKDSSLIVETNAPTSLKGLVNQRRRWAAKWKHHSDILSSLIPLLIFLINAIAIVSMIGVLAGFNKMECLVFLGVKSFLDFAIMFVSTRFLRVNYGLFSCVLLEIIYPFYVVFFGIASNFGKYSWKGREYKTNLVDGQN